jgi:peptidoglycan/LPS O-acetylase OafA/YrhL
MLGAVSAGGRLGVRFETSPNALNLIRLFLAVEVLAWHAYLLRGDGWLSVRATFVVEQIGVDAFFAISGFLICRSWQRRSSVPSFLLARARRILPGLWMCLVVTAFVVAPIACSVAGGPHPSLAEEWHYVVANAGARVNDVAIGATPHGVLVPEWNGSLWTLGVEVGCYLAVAVLGMARVLRRSVVATLAVLLWMASAVVEPAILPPSARLALMFSVGALLWLCRDRVPVTRALCWLAVGTVVLGAHTPNYRLLAAPGIAYLCIAGSLALGRHRRLVLRHDLSYGVYIYAFPVQQALLIVGVSLPWWGFTALTMALVLPVAALSWFLVERPAQLWGRHAHGFLLLPPMRPRPLVRSNDPLT